MDKTEEEGPFEIMTPTKKTPKPPAASPPEPEECLIHSRVSMYKGGTLIAEDVHDLDTHKKRLADPDGYRPAQCAHCDGRTLHVHDHLHRKLRNQPGITEIGIVRYICACLECRATWRILPALLPRHLWRTWERLEQTAHNVAPEPGVAKVPKRTAQRWQSRLASAAKQLVVLLASSGGVLLEALAMTVGLSASRHALVDEHAQVAQSPEGRRLADLAALIHRLARGLRLM